MMLRKSEMLLSVLDRQFTNSEILMNESVPL